MSGKLDNVIPFAFDRNAWIENNVPAIRYDTRCKKDEELITKYQEKTKNIRDIAEIQAIVPILKTYIAKCIPEPYVTEKDYWSLSFLVQKSKDVILLCRVNIGNQEVFTCHYDRTDNIHFFDWHVRRSILEAYLDGFPKDIWYDDHHYPSGGSDQCNIGCDGFKNVDYLFNHHYFLKAAKVFNIELMDKGKNRYSWSHCYQFADLVMS